MKTKDNLALVIGAIALPLLVFSSVCRADTIVLNDGKKIDGLVVEKSDSFIKVDVEGIELKFYNKDIKEIVPAKEGFSVANEKYAELERNSLLNKVLELSNIKKRVEGIAAHVADEYAQHRENIPSEVYEAGNRIIADSYSAENLYSSVADYFSANFKRDYFLQVKDFLTSPLNEKVVNLEANAVTSKGVEEMKEYGNSLGQTPPSAERTTLIKKLDEVTGATNMQIETTIALYKGLNTAINPVVARSNRLTPGELDMVSVQMRKELKSILKNVISVSLLYTYRSLSDEELKGYVDFWSSDSGKWFDSVSNEALISAMNKASERAMAKFTKLAQEIKQPDSGSEAYFLKRGAGEWIRR